MKESKFQNTNSLDYLKRINKHFEDFPLTEEETDVKRQNDSTIIFEGGDSIKVTEEHFKNLKEEVTQIRQEIILNYKKSQQ